MASDRLSELASHLTRLDEALDEAESKEVAALLRERRITLAEIAALGGVEKGSAIDELAQRRADRRAEAGLDEKPKRGRK